MTKRQVKTLRGVREILGQWVTPSVRALDMIASNSETYRKLYQPNPLYSPSENEDDDGPQADD
jgi:hypothetical protein